MALRTKLFQLRSNRDHYVEFQMGMDNFRFEFIWNDMEEKWTLSIYKNYILRLDSYFLSWALHDLLDPFSYMSLGSLRLVCEDGTTDDSGVFRYNEINRENIRDTIFRWDYDTR